MIFPNLLNNNFKLMALEKDAKFVQAMRNMAEKEKNEE